MISRVVRVSVRNSSRFFSSEGAAREVVLAARPSTHEAVSSLHFEVRPQAAAPPPLGAGQVRCKTLFLSVDPFLRCRFNEDTGVDYTAPYQLGQPISSAGIGVVQESADAGYAKGDLVLQPFDAWPWQTRAVMPASTISKIPPALALLLPVTALLGAVGQTGITALCAVEHDGRVGPGDVLVVSGAAGAVGHLAGQLAKARGARVIGICGGEAKGRTLTHVCGFDAVVDYKAARGSVGALAAALRAATGGGRPVTHYLDNVGGVTTDAVLQVMADGSHIILCGQIATYNDDSVPYPPPLPAASAALAAARGIRRERFLVLNYREHFGAGLAQLAHLVASGQLQALETVMGGPHAAAAGSSGGGASGIAGAPDAFVSMMAGGNVGKAVVKVAAPPPVLAACDMLRDDVLPAALKGAMARRLITPDAFSL